MEKKYYAVSWEDRDDNGIEMSKGITVFGGNKEECQQGWNVVRATHTPVFLRQSSKEEYEMFLSSYN